jgi:hypothetical protein
MGSGAWPRVAYLDGRYYVTIGATGCVVEPDGRAGKPGALWTGAGSGGYSITAAYGKALEILNVSPSPDPWGWGGNGTILGLTVGADGSSPETKVAEHRWGGAAANQADRVTKNVLVAARWRNCAGWPQGRPGGFKGSHDGTWPSGQTAAAFNGRSLLAAWTTGNFIDILRLGNRDIYLKRVVDGWHGIDEPPLKVVAGPTDEVSPVLASDGAGGAILAWERQDPRGGVAVEFAPIAEEADGAPPAVAYIQKMSDTKLIVGFDEPIAAGTVKPGAVAVGAAKVVSVAYNEEGPSLGREIVVETEPLAAGKAYPLAVTGIADTFGNAVSGATVEYVARPGAAQRTPFISRWLTIGKWPADYEADFVRAADCRPSPGDVVKGLTDAELTAHMKKWLLRTICG